MLTLPLQRCCVCCFVGPCCRLSPLQAEDRLWGALYICTGQTHRGGSQNQRFLMENVSTVFTRNRDHLRNLGHHIFYKITIGKSRPLVTRTRQLTFWEIWATLSVFLENVGHPQTIKIMIIKKCPELHRVYGNEH